MKTSITVLALVGAAIAAVVPRADGEPCSSTGASTAPEPLPNTLGGFTDSVTYDQLALSAEIPDGYELAMSNANCSMTSNQYMMYVQMDAYSPEACADVCSEHVGCNSCKPY